MTAPESLAAADALPVMPRAHAGARDPRALAKLARDLGPGPFAAVILFISPEADRTALAEGLETAFAGVTVIGCTTAGEISPEGYSEGEIVAVALPRSSFAVDCLAIDLAALDGQELIGRLIRARAGLARRHGAWDDEFAFVMVDGLSIREDELTAALGPGLGPVPLFGGSAGDGTRFSQTFVLQDGLFRQGWAVLMLVRTACRVRVFSVNHLTPTNRRMVVTGADPARRVVHQINAEPAAQEYARLLGKDPGQLTTFTFAAHPVVVRIGGSHHVRAIQRMAENGDLVFFSAIDEGLVLTLAEPQDIAVHLDRALADLSEGGKPAAILACDCILRRIAAMENQRFGAVSALLKQHGVVGFSTYGEQLNSMHVNQTMTGVAIYPPKGCDVIETLINPADSAERRAEKLLTIAEALMRRVEQATDDSGAAYAQFQRAALLEDQVRERTHDLGRALDLLNESNARLADAMREAETARQNLSNAIETVQEGFALFDREDRLVMCNSRFGMHMPDVHAQLQPGLAFSDYVAFVSRSPHLALPEGEGRPDWAQGRMRRHKDRHVIFNVRMTGDHWVQVSEHRTADGGTVILQTDVTDIIRAERHERGKLLDDQARVIRATLDHINQGVGIFDAEARLVGWNQRLGALLSLPMGRLRIGASFENLFSRFRAETQSDDISAEALMEWVAAGDVRPPLEFEVRRGEDLILDVFAQGMPDGGFVFSFTDVTSERAALVALSRANETLEARVMERTLELEDALAHAERANASRSRFVAAASHDLLQPLSAAKLFISSIGDEGLEPGAQVALEKAQNALMSVEGILDALLDISKLESGKAAVSVGAVQLNRLLRTLSEEFTPIAAAKGLALTVIPCGAVVESDPAYLRRILQNLIGNAIRYTETGRVLVGARRRGGVVRLEVWDTGPGIPEEAQNDIFKEFHRLNARASASEGMGLGLAIVERACGLLGHPLGLRSEVGRGTCFMLQLPLSDAGEGLPLPVEAPERRSGPVAADKIAFLVENDEELRRALGLLLEKWGMTVLEAASGEEALALIEEIGILPDIFLVDQQLGDGITGIEFLARIRAVHGVVPARLITANRGWDVRAAATSAGVEVLYKPIDPRALEAAVGLL